MKNYLFLTLLLIGSVLNAQDSFKEKFEQAFIHLSNESYTKALPILLEMEQMKPDNANTLFSIGNCYMHTIYDKAKAIPYYERILENYKNMTIHYKVGDPKEKKAPVETLHYLGRAYHFNYQFDEALAKYGEYKDVLDPNNKEYLKKVNRDIEITNNAIELEQSPVEMSVKGLANINTEFPEYRPKVTGDEKMMYFTSRRENPHYTGTDESGLPYEDIYVSTKKFGVWQEPKMLDETINKPSHDAVLYVSPDGQYMLIFRASSAALTEGGIYETKLEGENWTEPTLLQADINSNYWETDVSLSADGTEMFFTSDRPGGSGGRDIWMMRRLPGGEWASVQNMGPVLNTEYDEEAPYLHPDGKTLYFSSKGHKTMGGFDVFKSERQADGSWGAPENIGYPINTTGDDVFYFPTNDGLRAYFSSHRKGGKGEQDIYLLELPNFEPKTIAVYKGIAKYSDGEIIDDMVITIFDEETGEKTGIYRPNSTTGRFLFILQPGQRYEIEFESGGVYALDNVEVPETGGIHEMIKVIVKEGNTMKVATGEVDDNDIISLVEEEDPTNVEITEVNLDFENPNNKDSVSTQDPTITEPTNVTEYESQGEFLNDLYFIYDKVVLIDESEIDYDATLKYLKENPDAKVMIEGHTDSHGSSDYNWWLSSARANKIRNRLYDDGIAWGRMKTRGYGEDKPIAPNKNNDGTDNPEGRQKNRRVHFVLDQPVASAEPSQKEPANKGEIDTANDEFVLQDKPADEIVNDNYEVATVDISQEVICMVQLGAFSEKLDNEKFTDAPLEVAFYKDGDGLYKYLSGAFINKNLALEHRLRMIDAGYEGAFLVYFQDGKRLTQEEVALLYPTENGITIENDAAVNQ
ncbi:OmpA family protein [Parvicella tangerina]|uniref:Peptidoglycan-associated lipoprotein n=1 Tax=Parvicella tangerina TaxID=2829795 RepID=A0A916JJV4_9FLAO|nr:OmpA family protein [Parvicella tangerina]CAG5077458.1 Peptidoglycan-associated lipoprotein [Parvicella tangerina]